MAELSHFSIELSSDAVYWLSDDGRFEHVNEAACKKLGYSRDELLGMTVFDINPEYPRELWPDSWEQIKRDKTALMVTNHKTKSGDAIPVEISANYIKFEGREYSLRIVRDISERKLAEKRLRRSEERYRSLVDNIGLGISMIDYEHTAIMTNAALCRMFGADPNDLKGCICYKKFGDQQGKCENCPGDQSMKSGKPEELEQTHERKDGSLMHLLVRAFPLFNEDGPATGFIEVVEDFTERKNADLALREALDEVEELKNRLQAENIYLQEEIKDQHDFERIVGKSEAIRKITKKVEQVAKTTATVLILGESGTGKELLAHAVHNLSDRKDRPLVKVNCASLPAGLVESELFGHEKGAFTGALTKKIGRFELADGGTIFLDEIGDLTLDLQAKLLRVLQEGEFERLGSVKTIKVDARVIAATNRNLEKAVASGLFREDLYYRLNVFPVTSPPLRKRKEDVPILAKHFIMKYGPKMGKQISSVAQTQMDALIDYDWPGNVRELENVIERAIILSSGPGLELDEQFCIAPTATAEDTGKRTIKEMEKSMISEALIDCGWVIEGKRGAAARLDMAPSTLRERMKKYGLKRPNK